MSVEGIDFIRKGIIDYSPYFLNSKVFRMSILTKLDFAKKLPDVQRAGRARKSPLDSAKERLSAEIDVQIALAKNPKFKLVTSRKQRKSGKVVKTERKPRSWVTIEGDVAFVSPRYANKVLNIGGRKGAFVKTTPAKVAATLALLKEWVESSESDAVLSKAIARAKRGPRKGE